MSEQVEILQSVADKQTPRNILVYDETDVGKTLANKIILDELSGYQGYFDQVSVKIDW